MKKLALLTVGVLGLGFSSVQAQEIGLGVGWQRFGEPSVEEAVAANGKLESLGNGFGFRAHYSQSIMPLFSIRQEFAYSTVTKDKVDYTVKNVTANLILSLPIPILSVYGGAGLGYDWTSADYEGAETSGNLNWDILVGAKMSLLPFVGLYLEPRYTGVFGETKAEDALNGDVAGVDRLEIFVGATIGF